MAELSFLKILAELGITATVVGMAFFLFYKIINKMMETQREDTKELLSSHQNERREYRGLLDRQNVEFTSTLRDHTETLKHAVGRMDERPHHDQRH